MNEQLLNELRHCACGVYELPKRLKDEDKEMARHFYRKAVYLFQIQNHSMFLHQLQLNHHYDYSNETQNP